VDDLVSSGRIHISVDESVSLWTILSLVDGFISLWMNLYLCFVDKSVTSCNVLYLCGLTCTPDDIFLTRKQYFWIYLLHLTPHNHHRLLNEAPPETYMQKTGFQRSTAWNLHAEKRLPTEAPPENSYTTHTKMNSFLKIHTEKYPYQDPIISAHIRIQSETPSLNCNLPVLITILPVQKASTRSTAR